MEQITVTHGTEHWLDESKNMQSWKYVSTFSGQAKSLVKDSER